MTDILLGKAMLDTTILQFNDLVLLIQWSVPVYV